MIGLKGKLESPRVGQIGIVVRDVAKSVKQMREMFGIGPWAVFEGTPERCVDRGRDVSFRGKMALAQSGLVQVELIEIVEGEDTIHTEFLREHGEGVHHVGFFVRDLKSRLEEAKRADIEVLQHGVLKQLGLELEYVYLDTRPMFGVVFEFIRPSFLGLPFSTRIPLIRVGARIAASKR